MLLHFLSDYLRNRDGVKDRFSRDPKAVLDEYGLDAKALAALGTPALAAEQVAREINERATAGDIRPLAWGVEDMTVDRVEPASVGAGQPQSLRVFGTNFKAGVKVRFLAPGRPEVAGESVRFVDDRTLEVKATFAAPGAYRVEVWEAVQPPHGGWKDAALTVEG